MDEIDNEFGPIKRSSTKVTPSKIIKDGLENHDQVRALKRIKLFTKDMHEQHKPNDDDITEKERYVLERLPLQIPFAKPDSMTSNESTESESLSEFQDLRIHLLRKLNNTLPVGDRTLPAFLRPAAMEIERTLKLSVIQKESNSVIVVSPRSSYKTSTVNYHLDALAQDHPKQFIVVRLNGDIHSENAAINSIATQLENELSRIRSTKDLDFQLSQGSLTEVFENVLKLLDSVAVQMGRRQTALPRAEKLTVIFIFDEIDKFAGPVRQTLLYNLFDMVEHARVPVCILGCTTKLNVLEFLEKRVKSRFSQRLIYLPQIAAFDEFQQETKSLLSANLDTPNASLWNTKVEAQIKDQDSPLSKIVKANYETFRDLALLRNAAFTLVSRATSMQSLLHAIETCEEINAYNTMQLSNSLHAKVRALSDLQLSILLAAARVALKNEENVNFNLACEEYTKMVKSMNSRIPTVVVANSKGVTLENTPHVWKKKDLKNIWETLIDLELVVEKGLIAIRQSAQSAFQATNHYTANGVMPYDLKTYQVPITLQELRRIVPKSSKLYSWTQI
ncbi:HDL360Cp [Eremothecium sinecaudum]|uniref:Origin recognition complex subunit 4 n=1 Tax=Eremothecium sinecaudum TaxID=45286 RepID=A0A0X8HRZ7_9SACH|nr:HDL360Cp [Eremothecium sinecaudum]AMD20384.1 HDL360Cp [Eremothecium sinecaudum]